MTAYNPKDPRSKKAAAYRSYYNTSIWKQIRRNQLASNPLCRMCEADGRLTPATVCDHIEPHKGDWELFTGGPFQSLCNPCHSRHKQREERTGRPAYVIGLDGWPTEQGAGLSGLGPISHPEWFRPVQIPLTIVCGPPASGKTTYVAQHKGANDLVLDLDAIAKRLFGQGVRLLNYDQRIKCLKARNEIMGGLMRKGSTEQPYDHAWLIVAEPDAARRQWWADTVRPREIIVIETPGAVCVARAKADTKHRDPRTVEQSIGDWWSTYTKRKGDRIITL